MPIGPGLGSNAAHGRRAGRAGMQALVLISAMWLALAAMVGLIAALIGARRSTSPAPNPEAKAKAETKPDRRALKGWACLLGAVAGAAVAAGVYVYFNHEPVTANLTATTNNLSPAQVSLNDPGNASSVQWQVTGSATRLTVQGPSQGWAEVMLPVPRTACRAMAARLGGLTCSGGTIVSAYSPVVFQWTSPQDFFTVAGTAVGGEHSTFFDVQSLMAAGGVPSVITMAQGNTPAKLCFDSPQLLPVTLTVKLGPHPYPYTFIHRGIVACGQGITVVVGARGTMPPEFEVDGINTLTVTATGPAGTLQEFTGQLMLMPGGTTPLASFAVVSLSSRGSAPLTAVLRIKSGSQSFMVSSNVVTSVTTGGSQLLPSKWSQDNDILVPLLTSWVTGAVITPLGLAFGVLTDVLKRPSAAPSKEASGAR
jgi:hypothetical protein